MFESNTLFINSKIKKIKNHGNRILKYIPIDIILLSKYINLFFKSTIDFTKLHLNLLLWKVLPSTFNCLKFYHFLKVT